MLATIFAATIAVPFSVFAANIEVIPLEEDDEVVIAITGDIEPGDDDQFRKIAAAYSNAIVMLNSDGGTIAPAMDIGRTIKLRGYTTAVHNADSCASACALIWIAGTRRVVFEGGEVGFHASYLDTDGTKLETGLGNALVGHYLSQLGFGEKTVVFATLAPPDKILWLNSETASLSGIEFTTIPNDKGEQSLRSAQNTPAAPPPIVAPVVAPRPSQSGILPEYQKWMGDTKQTLRSPEAFVRALKQKGYQADLSYEDPKMPIIATVVGGETIAVAFSGCDSGGCSYVQFLDWITDVTKAEADHVILKSTKIETYSHPMWVEKSGDFGYYNYIIIGNDGITINTLIENMNYFVKDNTKLSNFLIEFRGEN